MAVKGTSDISSYSFYFYISDHLTRILTTLSTESGFLTPGEHASYIAYLIDSKSANYTVKAFFPEGQAILAMKTCIRSS
jgi:hypothetical protein